LANDKNVVLTGQTKVQGLGPIDTTLEPVNCVITFFGDLMKNKKSKQNPDRPLPNPDNPKPNPNPKPKPR